MPTQEGQLNLLGAPHWSCAVHARRDVPDNLPGYLVAYLAYRGDWVSREALAGLFWPERAEDEAQHNLRANLHRVRTLLATWGQGEALQAERRRVRIAVPTDVAAYRAALGRADWPAAVALHGEPLLSATSFRGFALLDEWARGERQGLTDAWRDAVLKASLAQEQAGEAQAAAALLLRLLQADAGTEDAMQALLRVALAGGRRDEALAAFERFCRWLDAELGLQPMPATVALAEALRAGTQTAARVAATAPVPGVPRAVIQPPRLIGREHETAQVADLTQRWIAVGGEPGVGKTRLLEDALPGARWIACREGMALVPFAPVIEYLHDYRDSLPDLREHRLDLARLLPELAEGELLPPADPALGKTRLLEALARVLEDGGRPLVFDDVQWADAATGELIAYLARRAQVPVRLAHRTTEAVPALDALLESLEATTGLQRLILAPLSTEQTEALLALLSQTAAGPPLFTAWLQARTGGNPFFVLQTLRALFENRRLSATAAGWASDLDAVTIDYSELEIPPRVAELVRRRLRGLSDTARRVLGVVAVCGSARDVERIAATVGLSPWATAEALAEAERAGLLRDGRFVHDVIRESHLTSLAEPLRMVLHGAVARQFAEVLPPARIAEHWWAARQVEPAVESTVAAAEDGRRTGLYQEAIDALKRALARELTPPQRARLRSRLAWMLYETNDRRSAETAAADALVDAGAPFDCLQALKVLASVALQDGRLEDARRLVERAERIDPGGDALLLQRTKLAAYDGTIAQLLPQLMRYHDKLRRLPFDIALVDVLITLSYAHGHAGDTRSALECDREAYALTTRMGASSLRVNAANNLVVNLARAGHYAEAISIGESVLATGQFEGSATLRSNVAAALKLTGRFDEALEHYNDLVGSDEPTVALIARGHRIHILGERGDVAAVQTEIDAALIAIAATELPVPRASLACHVLRFGNDSHVQTVLDALKPARLDPWLAERLRSALASRGIDPDPYVPGADVAAG